MEFDEFAELVSEALDLLPEQFKNALDNVDIVIEEWPSWNTLRMAHVRSKWGLLGFYHGVPLTERTSGYNLVSPDKISVYQRPIEAQCKTPEEIRSLVHRVVLHELAHHFGIDDNRLHEIGAY